MIIWSILAQKHQHLTNENFIDKLTLYLNSNMSILNSDSRIRNLGIRGIPGIISVGNTMVYVEIGISHIVLVAAVWTLFRKNYYNKLSEIWKCLFN